MLPVNIRGRSAMLIAGVVGMAYVLSAWALGAGIVDDTYIFLRYARNIWEGAGAVFNDGERVEGYTSPLWLAVLTLAWKLPADAPAVAVASSAAAGYATILLIAFWRGGDRSGSMLGALFLASNPSFVFWAWSGMDTALHTLLVVVAVLLFERDRARPGAPVSTGLAVGLAAAARLEAIWLLPLFAALLLPLTPRRRIAIDLVALCLPAVCVAALLTGFRFVYYDAWLPNTFAAKVGVPRVQLAIKGLAYLGTAAVTYAPLLAAGAFAMVRLPERDRRRELLIPLASAAWLTLYAVLIGGDHFALFRFLVAPMALAAVAVGRVALHPGASMRWVPAAAVLAANAFVLATPQAAAARSEVGQAEAWAKTGRWCAERLPEGSIASLVVGAIPYYCDRYTYDLLGLVDRHIATRGRIHPAAPAGHQKFDTDYILARQPDYVFFLSSGMPARPLFETVEDRRRWLDDKGFALRDLVTDPRTLELYEYRAERLPDETWVEWLERRP